MDTRLSYYTIVMGAFFTIAILTSYSNDNNKTTGIPQKDSNTVLSQVVEAPDLDKPFDFAGEALPMNNFDVRERLEKELLKVAYYHSSTVVNLKRTARYFPVIEKILRENGVPEDFKYLAVAESDLSNPTSPAGAKGYWQFLKGTALEYGLEVNDEVDERMDLEKSTLAACNMLKRYKERLGSWTMTAAAYNMGLSGLQRDAERQRSTDYYDLNLNEETGRYIFRIMAMKEILAEPKAYGFYLDEEDFYQPLGKYTTVEVNTSIENLADFAAKYGVSYRMLKIYNPWLVTYKLTNAGRKTYEIRMPVMKF